MNVSYQASLVNRHIRRFTGSTVVPVGLPAVGNRGVVCGVPCLPVCFFLQVVAAALITRIELYVYIFFFPEVSFALVYGVWCHSGRHPDA